MIEPLGPVHVRMVVGLDLVGWDEVVLAVFAACWLPGTVLGVWLAAVLLGAVR